MRIFTIFLFIILCTTSCINPKSEVKDGIINIGVVVKDIDESLYFYKEILGMKEKYIANFDEEYGYKAGLTGGIPFKFHKLEFEGLLKTTDWKLIEIDAFPDTSQTQYIQEVLGMRYITLRVKSISPFVERLKKNNISFCGETPIDISENLNLVSFRDPNGIFIELIGDK
ncbi:MAG: VOC family protein [Bacteroidales bacterium]|nr:VOC family protein [Bacteroidales bacterium]MBN2821173.1 VOC family protein [Bacteroidales bacterium]